ncbi:MAG: hypothetical protein IT582_04190 [Opitutaceae bacterium]|nr:hypothetical protein [Opitutaceae bacterium]
MTFTSEPPTTPGFYAFKSSHDSFIGVDQFDLEMIEESRNLIGYEWCRLVPAEEVENAYREASSYFNGAKSDCSSLRAWQDSRAKQVAEGKI